MSSKHKSSRRSNQYPTSWSEWAWNEQYQREARYREVSEGKWEWDYAESPEIERKTEYTPRDRSTLPPASLPAIDEDALPVELIRINYRHDEAIDRNYRHHEGVSDLNRRMGETSIESQSEVPQYSAGQQYPGYPAEHQYSAGQQYPEYPEYPAEHQYSAGQQYPEYPVEHQYPPDLQYQAGGKEYFESNKTDPGNGKGSETKCPECSMTFPRSTELERHHKTVHLNNGVRPYECLVPGCPANVRSWTTMRGLRLHEKNWHGPHSCSVPGCSRRHPFGFSSEADLEVHQVEHSGGSNLDQHGDERRRGEKKKGRSGKSADTSDEIHGSAAENYHQGGTQPLFQASSQQENNSLQEPSYAQLYQSIYQQIFQPSINRNISKATTSDDELLSKQFVVHNSREFYFGRVFKVLWSEPVGSGGTEITVQAAFQSRAHHKVRRFLIVSERNKGHSICIPILTYGNQGVLKRGVHPEDHAVVYSSKVKGPYLLDREKGLMTKHPIRVEVITDSHKLDPLSRLNYAKLYTVEHNVKVFFIGRVAKNYERDVKYSYNEAHPPFNHAGPGFHQGSHEDLTKGAEGNDPNYLLTEEPTQDRGGTSTYQGYQPYSSNSTYTVDANYTTPAYPTYTRPSYVSTDATATPSSSQTAQAAKYSAYDDGYDD